MRAALAILLILQNAPANGAGAAGMAKVDDAILASIAAGEIPGAVFIFGRHGRIVYEKAYGSRAIEPAPEPMTVDTIFDLASLTKVVATATSIAVLAEDGKLQFSDPVEKYIPGFAAGDGARGRITLEHLLTHRAGFAPDDPLDLYHGTPEEIFARKYQQKLQSAPGEKFIYSDVGFEVLGEVVRRVSGRELPAFSQERIFDKLQMSDTRFRPLEAGVSVERIAPTEKFNSQMLRGVVHDPRARALGGAAGHAGLFSTARDLAKYCIAILNGGGGVLSPAGVAAMTRPRYYNDTNIRGLGWDISTPYSGARGDLYPLGSFGHTGFTGTSMWLDPASDSFVILLTSAIHLPKGTVIALRRKVATLAAASITDADWKVLRNANDTILKLSSPAASRPHAEAAPAMDVLAGADVLEKLQFKPVANSRIALLTNHTGRLRDGRATIDLLNSAAARDAGVALVRLFSPEHGIRGAADEKVSDSVDKATNLPIVSLYGERRRPSPESLKDVDAVVVDLQDAGCRFYTYLATTAYVMEEAAAADVKVIILDRPDPIGASQMEGPTADDSRSSFISYHSLPIRTGMTMGEFAQMVNEERGIHCKLSVVPLQNYHRELYYDETGLVFKSPSPNLRSLQAMILYPGLCMLEFTNISVGRGTDTPFEQFGAPWLDGAAVAERLAKLQLPGVRFQPVEFTPAASIFGGMKCSGVRVNITDRSAVQSVRLGFEIACLLRDVYKKNWDTKRFGELIASDAIAKLFDSGATAAAILDSCRPALAEFAKRREKFLIYK